MGAAVEPPSLPVTPMRSPPRAPSRPRSSSASSAQPTTVTDAIRTGAATTSPPASTTPVSPASSMAPRTSSSAPVSPTSAQTPSAMYASPVRATPIAARSDSAPASARQPTSRGLYEPSPCRRKCTFSTIVSKDVTHSAPPARTTAASSPTPRTILGPGREASSAAIDSIRERSMFDSPGPSSSDGVDRRVQDSAAGAQRCR